MRPIFELLFGEDRFEKLQRRILVRVTFHVEVDEGTELSRPPHDRSQFRREMRDRLVRIGRIHLRIKCGDFHREIYNGEKLGIFCQRIGPVPGFARQAFQQIKTTRRIFVGLFFAENGLAQKIDSETDVLCAPLPQRFHYIVGIFPGDELARHSRDVPAQYPAAHPRNNARETNAGVNDRGEAIANTGEIFFEMLQNIARSAKRREYIYKAKHLHLEMLIAH